ncbi:MAG: hypothetical protein M3178_00910 [Pseudomonadota bacterium]|nr:hypothetical protein [Pseudomonadota bacterium]
MFAPLVARSQPKTAANATAKLAPPRSTLVAQFRGSSCETTPFLQSRLDQGSFQPERNEPGINAREQEARRLADQGQIPLQKGAVPSWDFSKISIFPPNQQSVSASHLSPASRPRIKLETIGFHPFTSQEARGLAQRDGSPDDLEEMSDDQDAPRPDVFERRGRGPHIRVSGGNPAGTSDFPDGIRWVQTIDTNAPLFGQSPPYVDFVPPKDDKPFYFPDARENATFSDNPTRRANGVRWDATLSLAGVRGRTITRLDSVNYGFDIDPSGTLSLHPPSTTGAADVVIHGDTLRSEYPDWVFSGGFAVPEIPGGAVTGETGVG